MVLQKIIPRDRSLEFIPVSSGTPIVEELPQVSEHFFEVIAKEYITEGSQEVPDVVEVSVLHHVTLENSNQIVADGDPAPLVELLGLTDSLAPQKSHKKRKHDAVSADALVRHPSLSSLFPSYVPHARLPARRMTATHTPHLQELPDDVLDAAAADLSARRKEWAEQSAVDTQAHFGTHLRGGRWTYASQGNQL